MYLYMTHGTTSDMHVIRLCTGTMEDTVWNPRHEDLLDADDWEEYVEPKKKPVFGNTKLTFDENGPHMGDTMTVEEYQKAHSGEKHTFKDLCDDYLEQQKSKVQINELPFTKTLELRGGEPVGESRPALKKVWTTYWDLDIQSTGILVDKADYPYTLCERDVLKVEHDGRIMVLAEPGFSQRTVHLRLGQDCWNDAKTASAALIHRIATRYGWNMEFFITLLDGVDRAGGDYNKNAFECESGTLGQKFAMDMEYWAQENAKVMHRLYYVINQYINLVRYEELERRCVNRDSSAQEPHHV